MGKKFISFQELRELAEARTLEVIDDFFSITNGCKSKLILDEGCLQRPPYNTIYSK